MFVRIRDDFANEMRNNGLDPNYFVNRILHQHFLPWAYASYENEIIDRLIEDLKPSDEELEIVHKYISYHVMKDFKERLYHRYDHSTPPNSLDYLLKRLSIAAIECKFNRKRIMEEHKSLISQIRAKSDFDVDTYIDNIIRVRFMPGSQKRILSKIDRIYKPKRKL